MSGFSTMMGAPTTVGGTQLSTGGLGLGVGMMAGGTGLNQSMVGIMQSALGGGNAGSAITPGVSLGMQNMLDIMDDFTLGQAAGASGSTNAFQGMAAAMSRVLTGSSAAAGSFASMLDAMGTFLSNTKAGSANASTSFQSMLDAMQNFVSGVAPGSTAASAPFQAMVGVMKDFLSNATSGSANAASAFQAMLDIVNKDLTTAKILSVPASTHVVKVMTNGDVQVSGADGTTTLTNMPRLHFTDKSIATDIDGNAGTTAKVLGLVFGADAVANKTYAGIGLNLLDNGMSYEGLMQTALTAKLGANFTTADEVKLAYQNLLGIGPSEAELQYWEHAVGLGQFTQASLAVMAAETSFNTNNIHLVGLAQTGLEYVPIA